MRARFFAKMFSRARWFGGKEEEPNLRSPLSKLRRVHSLKVEARKRVARERARTRKERALIAESRRCTDERQEIAIEKKRNLYSDEGDTDYLEGARS